MPTSADPGKPCEGRHFPLASARLFAFVADVHPGPTPDASNLPVIDVAQAGEVLSLADPTHAADLRAIFTEMETVSRQQLAMVRTSLDTIAETEARRALHSLKGGVATFGLARCAAVLNRTEKGWAAFTIEERRQALATAADSFAAGMQELRARFPYLGAL